LDQGPGGVNDITTLVARARKGDELAFRQLVECVRDRVYRQALVQTGDGDDAEDVTQEVLVRLHLQIGRFRGDARFETWLFTLTRNAAADQRRKRNRPHRIAARLKELAGDDRWADADPLDALEASRFGEQVRGFLVDLSERQRTVFDLIDLQGYAAGEVAEMLGMQPVTVRTHLLRARRAIRSRLLRSGHERGAV